MSFFPVDNLDEGSILDDDVHDINGRLLLSKGQVISPKHIRVLKIWGVTEVNVVNEADASADEAIEADPLKMARVEEAVQLLYVNLNLDHSIMEQIYRCAVDHRYENDLIPAVVKSSQIKEPSSADLNFKAIQNKINHSGIKLPAAPTLVVKLNRVMEDPHASASDVAQIVSTSPSLTALMLRIVNSAAFGLPRKVDRISRAVSLLGTREISSLALGISVMQAFRNIPDDLIDMTSFMMHSLACATIARILAALANISHTEQLFIAGLLHDIGKLILFKYFPEHAKALFCLSLNPGGDRSVYEIEKSTMGKTHSQVARLLLKKWNFPRSLQDNIICHHTPSRSQTPAEAAIIQVADIMAHGMGFGSSGERIIPGFDENAWEQTGISPNTIKMAIRQATHQLKAAESIFL